MMVGPLVALVALAGAIGYLLGRQRRRGDGPPASEADDGEQA